MVSKMDATLSEADTRGPHTKTSGLRSERSPIGNEDNTNKAGNRNRNKNRNKKRNRNRNGNKKTENKEQDEPKPMVGGEEVGIEKSQAKSRRRRNNNEPNKKNTLHYSKEINVEERKQTAKRQEEIDQCIHALSDFKLFRKGKHVTSYGYRISVMTNSGKISQKVLFNIPFDYPKAPMKLAMRSNEEVSFYMDIVIANFNWKARQLVKEKWRILSQINYLISEFETLKMANYKQIDKLRNSFYKTI